MARRNLGVGTVAGELAVQIIHQPTSGILGDPKIRLKKTRF